jgi:hypothetical protein
VGGLEPSLSPFFRDRVIWLIRDFPVWFFRDYLISGVWNFLKKLAELLFVRWFLGYGYQIGKALFILLTLGVCFALFYGQAFDQGAFALADKDIRHKLTSSACKHWSNPACPKLVGLAPFNA